MTTCTFRPPWPFEMQRFAELVGSQRPANGWMRPRVWETPEPRRFAGGGWWSPPETGAEEPVVEVRVTLRPRYLAPVFASEMLHDLFAEIRSAGFAQVHLVTSEREIWEPLLSPFGLNWKGSDELWSVDAASIRERLARAAGRFAQRQPVGWCARPIEERDWEFIATQSGAAEFLVGPNFERVRRNLDADLSSMVESLGGPAGVLLATRIGMTVALEFLGAAAEQRPRAPWISHLAITRLARCDSAATQFDRLVLTTNPARGGAARALARRFNGKLMQTYHHFDGSLKVD